MLSAVSVVPSKERASFYLAAGRLAGFSMIKFTPAGFLSPSLLFWKHLGDGLTLQTSARAFGA